MQNKYGVEMPVDSRRIYIVLIILLTLISGIISRLWYLQIINGKEFAFASEQNRFREIPRPASRGLIYDRDGQLLLANRPFFDLVIIPQYLDHKDNKILDIVSELFSISAQNIEKKLQNAANLPKFIPITIKSNLSLHEVAILESNKFFLPGVEVLTVQRRDYTHNESAHLLGYLGEVGQKEIETLNAQNKNYKYRLDSSLGKMGVEKKYESYLRGFDGKDYLQVDAQGRLKNIGDDVNSIHIPMKKLKGKKGNNIYLTIDIDVQKVATEAFREKNGAVVAIDPNNGEIIAYVSNPNFDLSIYQDGLSTEDWQDLQTNPFKPLLDKVTGGAYPPGSTYKIITAIAGLEENVITPNTSFFCGGSFTYGNHVHKCWKKTGHGSMNLKNALMQSCDVYFFQVGNLLGIDRMAKWGKQFGLGEKTDLNLNMEVNGIAPSTDWLLQKRGIPWQGGDTISAAIGQGYNLVTPLQIANVFATFGNGGKLWKPHILKKILDYKSKLIYEEKPELKRTITLKPITIENVGQGLQDVVMNQSGTGKNARVHGFNVAGKSGTAQTISKVMTIAEQQDISFMQRDHAWFIAYAPVENPEIAVAVLSEHDGSGGGGAQAAPIVQKVLEAYLRKKHPDKFPKDQDNLVIERKKKIDTEIPSTTEVLPAEQTEIYNENNEEQIKPTPNL